MFSCEKYYVMVLDARSSIDIQKYWLLFKHRASPICALMLRSFAKGTVFGHFRRKIQTRARQVARVWSGGSDLGEISFKLLMNESFWVIFVSRVRQC